MDLSPVLSPSGDPIFTMGGRDALQGYPRPAGEWIVSLEWMKGTLRGIQKVLVIWPANRIIAPGATAIGAWTINSKVAFQFVGFNREGKCDGLPSEDARREALKALPILGKDPNDRNALHSLLDVLTKYLPELVRMPVAPAEIRRKLLGDPMWDVTATNKSSGRVIDERSV
jgi:hypothetical protein